LLFSKHGCNGGRDNKASNLSLKYDTDFGKITRAGRIVFGSGTEENVIVYTQSLLKIIL
jgi:hypothetical protein